MKVQRQRGIALVITLIMLSVITFLAVAFITLSRREKASMTTALSQTDARLMADTALERVKMELLAKMMVQRNLLVGDALVSRTFQSPGGFDPAVPQVDTNNVNFDRTVGNVPLNPDHLVINIGNLLFDPRVPVYVKTNYGPQQPTIPLDFRFYVDWNRNGRYETNGFQTLFNDAGNPVGSGYLLGEAEWIGVLANPERAHAADNPFIGRYAYFVVPMGRSLDLNYVHNYVKGANNEPMTTGDKFFRNQGVGSWEINLAGYLFHLNTNVWSYTNNYLYSTNSGAANIGAAFDDALSILSNRYRATYSTANIPDLTTTLGPLASGAFTTDFVDGFANGYLQWTGLSLTNDANDGFAGPWPGSRSTNMFYDVQELFDTNKTSKRFVDRLQHASSRTNSYDRYTTMRLLSTLGASEHLLTGSPLRGKIHINYDNGSTNLAGVGSPTNFYPWTAVGFFTNAAEALIQRSLDRSPGTNFILGGLLVNTNFSLTNIQIYPTNEYSPELHRLLQVAANIFAATTNGHIATTASGVTNLPYVFRPEFRVDGSNVFIAGFREVTNDWSDQLRRPFVDVALAADRATLTADPDANVFGVPWVISAKKGLPNFNEFTIETEFRLTRKLNFTKRSHPTNYASLRTNQMYVLSVTNRIGVELWNSYTSTYPRTVRVIVTNFMARSMTNESGTTIRGTGQFQTNAPPAPGTYLIDNWVGAGPSTFSNSFVTLLNVTNAFVPEMQYTNHPSPPFFVNARTNAGFETNRTDFYIPDWDFHMTNRLICAMVDTNANRLIEFVNLDGLVTHIDLTRKLLGSEAGLLGSSQEPPAVRQVWVTNRMGGSASVNTPTEGIIHQIAISTGAAASGDEGYWDVYSPGTSGQSIRNQQDAFRRFLMGPNPPTYLSAQAPFTPTRVYYHRLTVQANDPLVRHTISDLTAFKKGDIDPADPLKTEEDWPQPNVAFRSKSTLGGLNEAYRPWGGKRPPFGGDEEGAEAAYELSLKDPLVRWSDDWEFPTNKFASIGWLGRVHRGTPWQTLYLKSSVAATNNWINWAGNQFTHATNDWKLLDLFTTAPSDSAARGLWSVNNGEIAGWSAVLSGVVVMSNSLPDNLTSLHALTVPRFEPVVIEPYAQNEVLQTDGTRITTNSMEYIVNGINAFRATRPAGVYSAVAEIMMVPQLTVDSPFLNIFNENQRKYAITDAAYERIPHQVLSLLRTGEPRYVVYAYGQSLKPAERGIVLDPPRDYLQNICTNYQITGEVITRAVLRVDGTPDRPKVVVESFTIVPEE